MNVEPIVTIATNKFQPKELEEPEEGEHLFHSHMWVKRNPLHLIFYSGIQKNIISKKVTKLLNFKTTLHPHPYTIS
jgi:hypothetical protein